MKIFALGVVLTLALLACAPIAPGKNRPDHVAGTWPERVTSRGMFLSPRDLGAYRRIGDPEFGPVFALYSDSYRLCLVTSQKYVLVLNGELYACAWRRAR